MRKTWECLDKPLWLTSILIGTVLTLVVDKLPSATRVIMVEIVLVLINGIFSIWSGYWIYEHQRKRGKLFIFPILYLITTYFFTPRYTYYFALAYLALTHLSWAVRQQK